MKVIFITEFDVYDRDVCSGTAYWIPFCLKQAGVDVETIQVTTPERLLSPVRELVLKGKQFLSRVSGRGDYETSILIRRAEHVAKQLEKPLQHLETDVIVTALSPLVASFLNAKQPIVYWTDFLYSACANFYPNFRCHSVETRWEHHIVTNQCLMNSSLLIFSSHWAARTAVEVFGISPKKIHVIPFGPNLEIDHDKEDVTSWIAMREKEMIKLLFVGKHWFRKGGDIVLSVAKKLKACGHEVQVTLVGSKPDDEKLPSYVRYFDFISKNNCDHEEQLKTLYRESHFLFVPSRAEAFGIVFCEASAFALPSLATFVGGISDIVKENINGMTFALDSSVDVICDYIVTTLKNRADYEALCKTSFNEYQTRLNWQNAGQEVKKLFEKTFS